MNTKFDIAILNFLYKKYSKYIYDTYVHIEKYSNENVFFIYERNNYLKQINKLICLINDEYRNKIEMYLNKINNNNDNTALKKKLSQNNISPVYSENNIVNCNIHNEIHILMQLYEKKNIPYKQVHDGLCILTQNVGFKSLKTGMDILCGESYKILYSTEIVNKIFELNMLFVPLKYVIKNINVIEDTSIKNIYLTYKQEIILKKSDSPYLVLLDNVIDIYMPFNNELVIIFTGHIKHDPMNIILKTSQTCNNFLYNIKKKIDNCLVKIDINIEFKKQYMLSLSLCDIVLFDELIFTKALECDFIMFNNLTKMNFTTIMKEFVSSNDINNMFKIIKLLLLGSNDDATMAGLLFGILKDKKMENNIIANIIYKNLNYFLQIRLRNMTIDIKNELEKIKKISSDNISLEKQLLACKNIPKVAKRAAIEKIKEMSTSNNEYFKQYQFVKTIINFPWPNENDDNNIFKIIGKNESQCKKYMEKINKTLNNEVYGHVECKEEIQQLIGKWFSNPACSGMAFSLVGPPGVGKTMLAKTIGKSLNMPFIQITLGGQNDSDLLHGHSYTYSGAQPGIIVKKIVEVGTTRCIVYFDELDKSCCKHDSNEISNTLLHLIDKNTNNAFQDRFFSEVTFPMDKVIFIFSYNDSSVIDKILLDRIREIRVYPYSINDKIHIASNYIINDVKKSIGFSNDVIFDNNALIYLIENYTKEAGVRELFRKIEKIFLKMNIDKIYLRDIFINKNINKIIIDIEKIKYFLDSSRINSNDIVQHRKIHTDDIVGIVNGLFATSNGDGGILPIQILDNFMDSKFVLRITGNQGKIMKESCMYSFTTAMSLISDHCKKKFYNEHKLGLHIHTPDSSPKEGPSAGVSLTVAFISKILNKKINHYVAITGEIEMTGEIKAIGGLQYKLYGAKKAGIKYVFIPIENKNELEKIVNSDPSIIDKHFVVKTVSHIYEILPEILIEYNSGDFIRNKYLI